MKADDADEGDFGHVQYRLDPLKDAFTIDQETGVIFTNKDYKFESDTYSFKLTVVAFDSYNRPGNCGIPTGYTLFLIGKVIA